MQYASFYFFCSSIVHHDLFIIQADTFLSLPDSFLPNIKDYLKFFRIYDLRKMHEFDTDFNFLKDYVKKFFTPATSEIKNKKRLDSLDKLIKFIQDTHVINSENKEVLFEIIDNETINFRKILEIPEN